MRSFAHVICIGAAFAAAACNRSEGLKAPVTVPYSLNRCGGVPAGWSPQGSEYGELMAHNTLIARTSGFAWNGVAISADTLQSYLRSISRLNPRVNIQVVFDERADCRLIKETRAMVAKDNCRFRGQCVEYSEAEYQAQLSRHAAY
jgi:hypothetical protein